MPCSRGVAAWRNEPLWSSALIMFFLLLSAMRIFIAFHPGTWDFLTDAVMHSNKAPTLSRFALFSKVVKMFESEWGLLSHWPLLLDAGKSASRNLPSAQIYGYPCQGQCGALPTSVDLFWSVSILGDAIGGSVLVFGRYYSPFIENAFAPDSDCLLFPSYTPTTNTLGSDYL